LVDVICLGFAGAADVKLIGVRGEWGALGVSRVFNIIRSIDFVRKGPAVSATGSDRLVSRVSVRVFATIRSSAVA
jgi:hypothetical protein